MSLRYQGSRDTTLCDEFSGLLTTGDSPAVRFLKFLLRNPDFSHQRSDDLVTETVQDRSGDFQSGVMEPGPFAEDAKKQC